MKKYIIGLDLGINNVGYSIVDQDTNKIIKTGVRLYSPANKAEEKRSARNTRRRMKRKDNRINEVLKLFESVNFPGENTIDVNLLEKRIQGLKAKLEKQEIVNIICYYMSHRGYIPFGDEERELVDLQGMYPCEYYQKLSQEIGKHRALNKVINHIDLEKELTDLLTKQIIFYPELNQIKGSKEEKEGILWIFSRKRKFWEGPGSINSFTPYGRFKNEEDVEEYNQLKKTGKEKYLFEDLIGHCKIYINEKCVPKSNFLAEKFNLLNDFINIRVLNSDNIKTTSLIDYNKDKDEYKLSTGALEEIIKYCLNFEGTLSYTKVLKEVLGLTKDDIAGYRIKKDGKPVFSLMNSYRIVINNFKNNNLNFDWLIVDNYRNYNQLIEILALAPGKVEIEKMLSPIHKCTEEELNTIKVIKDKLKKDGLLEYHSLSYKALERATNDMLSMNMNFMQVSQKNDYEKESREYFVKNYGSSEGKLLMTTKYIDDIIASPQVKKTLKQSIKIINAIIKEQGGFPEVIAIESTKEMNGDELKKEIENNQKINEKLREEAKKILENLYSNDKITENMIERVKLYQETNGECPYCGKNININDVLNNTIEVEHILPISESADNSQDNKTISCRDCNSKKSNRTPYNFLSKSEFEQFENRVLKYKISENKINNFLTKDDINKHKIRFFNRNLRDTAYATKELVNQVHLFNEFLKLNLNNTEIKTLSTPGQLTHDIRSKWNLKKDRDDGKYHHAVDASIVAGIATTKIGEVIIESQNDKQFWINKKEAMAKIPEYLKNFSLSNMKDEINKIKSDNDINISMQVIKNPNRQIADANINSYIKKEEDYYKIRQINDIYAPNLIRKDEDKKKLDVLFDEKNSTRTLLCQDKDPKLFAYLKEIYEKYQHDKDNPFRLFCEERLNEGEEFSYLKHGIKTPSKNNKGVIIKKLRYMKSTNSPFLLEKNNINKKENTYIGLDSVGIYCTRLFWDKDLRQIIFIPVYVPCVNFQTRQINQEHKLYKYYTDQLKERNVEFIVDLFYGNYLKIEKSNGDVLYECVAGYHKASKSLQCKSGKYLSPKDKFTLYDTDILGNRKKRLTWPKD